MTRRAKLSLCPDNEIEKKQAPGFEAAAAAENPEITSGVTEPSAENNGSHAPSRETDKAAQQTDAWIGGRKVVKVVLVIIAAALSLYLLKRRLV